jgi:rRNA pseudouridine-1189 N-methylase Emg1 (Nep1/Mra1 family)
MHFGRYIILLRKAKKVYVQVAKSQTIAMQAATHLPRNNFFDFKLRMHLFLN